MASSLEVMMTYGGEVSVNTVRLAPGFRGLEKRGGKPGWIMTSDEDGSFRFSLSVCVCVIYRRNISWLFAFFHLRCSPPRLLTPSTHREHPSPGLAFFLSI